jgi:hypothetical protein
MLVLNEASSPVSSKGLGEVLGGELMPATLTTGQSR